MPGGWLGTDDGDYQAYTPRKGDILEIRVVDEAGGDQGTLLVAVVSRQECPGPGEAFSGFILGASDEYYRYWIAEGEGKEAREDGLYHLCFKSIEECRTWRGRREVVHTDKFRLVTPTDIREGRVGWLKQRATRAEVVGQLARYETKFPPQRVRKRPKPEEAKAAEKDKEAGDSASEEEDDTSSTSSAEEVALLKKMTRLQEELKAAEKLVEDKKGVKAKRKAMKTAMKAKDSKTTKKKDKGREASPLAEGEKAKKGRKDKKDKKKDKGSPDSRGRNKKRRRGSSDSDGSKGVKKKKKKKVKKDERGKERSSASAEDDGGSGEALFKSGERKKKPKDRRGSDRGPFGGGVPVKYKDEKSSESDSGEDSVFREAPASSTTLSGQQKLTRYSQRYPGRLASRLLLKMKEGAARELVGANNEEGSTPPLASHFILTVLLPQLGAKASLRTQRELRTLGKSLDLLARGETGQCADLLGQRIKALERASTEGHWQCAQFLELLPPDNTSLLERDEEVYLTREFLLEQKVRRYDKTKFPPIPPGGKKGGEKGEKGEKGKGKGKNDKTSHPPPKTGKEAEK